MEIGTHSIHFDQLTSTNDFALKLLYLDHPPEGLIISTDHQFKGKGQRNSSWLSDPDQNITLSIIIYPDYLNASAIYILNKAVCLGVAKCVEHFMKIDQIFIKWPNDVYVRNQKIAGILIQSSILGKVIQNSVIGVGLNVNQLKFPSEINATSFRLFKNITYNLMEIQSTLLSYISDEFIKVKAGLIDSIDSGYHTRLLGLNQERTFVLSKTGKTFTGKIMGVDQQGKLHIKRKESKSYFQVKEIEFLI